MSTTAALQDRRVLADLVPAIPTTLVRDVALVVGGAALTGIAAQFAFTTPLSPIPFTLQPLSVLLVGAALGTKRALSSMLLYLALGMVGLPWFADGGSGWHMPSFGYILGFVVAGGVVGALAKRGADRSFLSTVGMLSVGMVIIYVIGTTWLAFDLGVSAGRAFELGVRPFLGLDVVKILVSAVAFPTAWRFANTNRSDG